MYSGYFCECSSTNTSIQVVKRPVVSPLGKVKIMYGYNCKELFIEG